VAEANLVEWMGAAVTAAGALAGATAYITSTVWRTRLERQAHQQQDLQDKYAALQQKYQQTLDAGTELSGQKREIDAELSTMADRVGATASSVFIPAPSTNPAAKPEHLVFFAALGERAGEMRRQRVPMATSDVGRAFTSRQPVFGEAAESGKSFSANTDKAFGVTTKNKLAVPLFCDERCVGVVQFLNKQGDSPVFSAEDLDRIVRNRGSLSEKVGRLTRDVDNLRRFGITPSEDPFHATVLFGDISNSSALARNVDTGLLVDMFNGYFEALCDAALEFGGTIDQFLGDGFMVTFNAKRTVADHEKRAVQAAIRMQQRFSELKARWVAMSYAQSPAVFNRIGIASGPVTKAEMGHPQYKHITVMGPTVNNAHQLCQDGNRTRNVIVISESVYSKLQNVPAQAVGTVGGQQAYELDFDQLPPEWSVHA
jgi:class 3 adenylate cyclase